MSEELKKIRNKLRNDLKELNIKIPELALKMWSREVCEARRDLLDKVEKKLNECITNCKVDSFYQGADLGIKEALKIIKELKP